MRLKGLFTKRRFRVMGAMKGDTCPTERFLISGEKQYAASRDGLMDLLRRAADDGLAQFSSELLHLVDQSNGIYEFIKGDLRLLFFKGFDGVLVVCTGGYIKKGQKAPSREVAQAVRLKQEYISAKKAGTIQIEGEHDGNAGQVDPRRR